jgi:NADH-quinone oxidoreductase subunit G
LRTQRLDSPYLRVGGRLQPATWSDAFAAIAGKVAMSKPNMIGAIAGDLASVEELFALKELMGKLGSVNIDARQDGSMIDPRWGRGAYLFNATIAGIEKADALLIVGSNPRKEASVLNARIRKRWRMGHFPIGVIGEKVDLTYPYHYVGAGPDSLGELASGKGDFAEILKKAERPLIVVGEAALARADGPRVASMAAALARDVGAVKDGWNGFCMLHHAASRVGALDIGFVPGQGGHSALDMANGGEVLFLLGADEIDIAPGAFVVYIGTHGDRGAHRADVILPGAAYPEKSGIYVNTEGRVQMAERASFPPGDAREDWAILRALSEKLKVKLPYDSLAQLRAALGAAHPHLLKIGQVTPADPKDVMRLADIGGKPDKLPFESGIEDFYLTNPIARASAVMAECSAIAEGRGALTAAE